MSRDLGRVVWVMCLGCCVSLAPLSGSWVVTAPQPGLVLSSLSAGASLPSAGERSAPFLVVSADPAYGSISPDSAALDSGVQVFTLLGTDLELVAAVMLAGCDGDITTTELVHVSACLLYTSPSPRDGLLSRMPSSA